MDGMREMAPGGVLLLIYLLFLFGLFVLSVVIAWRIVGKTGYPGVLGLLLFVPVANLVMLLLLAFSEWPIERELQALRAVRSAAPR